MWSRKAGAAAAVLAALSLLAPVRTRLNALAVMADALELPLKRPMAADIRSRQVSLGPATGDLYEPQSAAAPVVMLPGAAPAGRSDPRVIRVASALARSERLVFVPELTLYEQRFAEEDIDNIVEAAIALSGHPKASGKLTIVGFSYGGTFGLLAAADPRLDGRISKIAVFGAYADLLGVVQAATTGVSRVGGQDIGWKPDPRAERLLHKNAVLLAPEENRAALESALETENGGEALSGDARVLYDLVTNRRPGRTREIAGRLSPPVRARIERFSPSSVARHIEAPIEAMHARDDPLVPYGEALRLKQHFPDSRLLTVRLFRHVDFRPSSAKDVAGVAADLGRVWRFTARILQTR